MEYTLEHIEDKYGIEVTDLLAGNSKLRMFEYSQEEYDSFCEGFDPGSVKFMLEDISRALRVAGKPIDKHMESVLDKTTDAFYNWLSSQTDDTLDKLLALPIINPAKEASDEPATTVQMLDGYIAISSSNITALDRFRDRILKTNDLTYEHRVKKHDGVEVHSYVFNMTPPPMGSALPPH